MGATVENLTHRGRGRPKGAPNRLQREAKDVIAQAAAELGGCERLVKWAREAPENERAFWATIYPKLLPLTVHGPGEKGAHVIQMIERRIVHPTSD